MTELPAHAGLAEAAIETLTGNNGFTVMVIVLDVAGFPLVQVALEVISQVMVFPLEGINE